MKSKDNACLNDYRRSIDNIDGAMIFLLAERFRITDKVGNLKKNTQLPPEDSEREQRQIDRLIALSEGAGLNPDFLRRYMSLIMSEVKRNHTSKIDE